MIYFKKIENYKKFLAYKFIYVKMKLMNNGQMDRGNEISTQSGWPALGFEPGTS